MLHRLKNRFSRGWRPEQLPLILSGLFLTLLLGAMLILQPGIVRRADLDLYDLLVVKRAAPLQSSMIQLVGVDEASLAEYGQWPWPRYRLAQLVERLQQLGAEVVVLDFLMPEPDRTSPGVIQAERSRDHFDMAAPVVAGEDGNSMQLARVLGQGKSVLGYYLDFSGQAVSGGQLPGPDLPAQTTLIDSHGISTAWPQANGEIRSLPVLVSAAAGEGFTNAVHDADGVLRRVPLLLPQPGGARLSLALAAVLLAGNERDLRLSNVDGENFLDWQGKRIPLDSNGNMLLDFRSGSPSFPYVSAASLLSSQQGPDLRGRVVLVGAWAKGLGDLHQTPAGRAVNGLEVHATVIDNVLSGRFIHRPAWGRGVELLATLLLGFAITLLLSRADFRLSLVVLLAGVAVSYWGSRVLLVNQGLYLSPLLPMAVPVVITTFLSLLKYGLEVRKVQQRNRDLLEAHDTIIIGMSALAEARDQETGHHLLRTQRYVGLLARQLSTTPKYAYLHATDIDLLAKSAPLHDIGKVGIPDSVLHKPGKLSEEEYRIMQTHPLIGADALTRVVVGTGHPEKNTFLNYARQMIESHHERWDGKGYPHGLRGESIPLPGRLMALADVYDALISQRVYKKGMSHEQTREFILGNAGTHFDPDVVAAFMATEDAFIAVARQFADKAPGETGEAVPPG